jgi:hypothetical protein
MTILPSSNSEGIQKAVCPMKTLILTLVAVAAASVSSATFTTPVSAHSTNAFVIDVYDFCGADKPCRISGALACQNHHSVAPRRRQTPRTAEHRKVE